MKPIPQANLTPGQKLAAALDRECPEERLAAVISEGLTATQRNRDGTESADYRTRLSAAQLALHFKHGKPIERQIVQTEITHKSEDDGMKLLDSPAVRKMLRKMLEEREAGTLATPPD
jgi:hypothetical protein